MHYVIEERHEAIKQLLAGVGNIRTFEDVSRGLDQLGWIVHPVKYQSKIIGAILEKDGEIHTSISPDYQRRWNPRPYIKNILYPALDKYGVIYSHAKREDLKAQRWLAKLGFEYTHEDCDNLYYALKAKRIR